ncbi:MAG: hypothetical protein C3F13_19235 [Anaerolineales bacterium]|nr:MAG: hypothetical protein C3F13_19235 [Anaerolineales bacterium]
MMRGTVIQEPYMLSTNPPPRQNHPKKKVLIVDDMPQVLHDLRQLLELTGLFEIVGEAANGFEAIRQVGYLLPDAVVLDLEMPKLDGFDATRQIKARHPSTRVIILSAYGGKQEIEQAMAAGADGFVIKGAHYEVLVDALLGEINSPGPNYFKIGE